MNKTFVTSDTHWGHANIIRFCNRPFKSVEDMDAYMINKWNETVGVDDTVFHLGDIAFLPGEKIVDILMSLNGKIKLVPGNHDKRFLKYKKKCDIDPSKFEVLDPLLEINLEGRQFTFCHFPLQEWNGSYAGGTVHLHGHTHSKLVSTSSTDLRIDAKYTMMPNGEWYEGLPNMPNRYDIGVDMYGGPVQITHDLSFLKNPKGWHVTN